ncbi:acetyltransferase [Rhodovulum sulfidophilum]|uniref:Acetyltransferase n=1 Tax=Rhodovulum sulfidophilum TaxID=35806 RepID=A0A0D6B7K5_RHOSU|nr:acetyltransferase [Rhodovulum sulfidophilum]
MPVPPELGADRGRSILGGDWPWSRTCMGRDLCRVRDRSPHPDRMRAGIGPLGEIFRDLCRAGPQRSGFLPLEWPKPA